MSEQEKSLGEIAQQVFYSTPVHGEGEMPDFLTWEGTDPGAQTCWEACAQAVAARVREECARLAEDFQWQLPLAEDIGLDSATDDAACSVQIQIASAIRAMNEASHEQIQRTPRL